MSRLSKAAKVKNEINKLRLNETVTNFMGGDSYKLNPLQTLKMVSASSIFGESSYYRGSGMTPAYYSVNKLLAGYTVLSDEYCHKTTDKIFVELIDAALDYDFKSTLEWAATLRKDFFIRLNPQVIMVRAARHPARAEFTAKYPSLFNEINQKVMSRADDALSQMSYYLYDNDGKKNCIPSILKRSWAEKLGKLNAYQVNKYKNSEIGMINAVRICHANSSTIDELMETGAVTVDKADKTWEQYRSEGKSWVWILENITLGHMALLRNLRGIFTEINDLEICKVIMQGLKDGVKTGKQFPFRYWSALKAIQASACNHKAIIIDALEECMDIACENFPKLKGKTMCLSDNSGSAWHGLTTEYGSTTIAEIDNLSSVITAACSEEGYVGKFGDRLIVTPISKRRGILTQTEKITEKRDHDVGGATEGGIWEFFKNAIDKKEHWDNIFIYSDQQAGHGGLYGTSTQSHEYGSRGYDTSDYGWGHSYINVFKLIQDYRKYVNPKVNVFSIQTAGYNNVLIPENIYRGAILYGWTGREAVYADEIIRQWDEIES